MSSGDNALDSLRCSPNTEVEMDVNSCEESCGGSVVTSRSGSRRMKRKTATRG